MLTKFITETLESHYQLFWIIWIFIGKSHAKLVKNTDLKFTDILMSVYI